MAEETGLVVDMGRWVFAEACRQLAAWRREYPELPLVVRVNMSPAQFVISGLVEFVENCLRVHRIPGERLCIEMTEHAVLQEPEQTARILRGFQALGVEVAIDDFGTGYASFTELKHLPVNFFKLDQTFVQGIDVGRQRPGHRRGDHPARPGARPRGHRRGHRVRRDHRQAARAGLPSRPGLPHVRADVTRGARPGAPGRGRRLSRRSRAAGKVAPALSGRSL